PHGGSKPLLRVLDGGPEIATAHREFHRRISEAVFPPDVGRTLDSLDARDLSERNLRALGRRDEDLADRPEVLPVRRSPAHDEVEVFLALVDLRDRLSAD